MEITEVLRHGIVFDEEDEIFAHEISMSEFCGATLRLQREKESCTAAEFAFHPDGPAMQGDKLLDKGEPDAGSFVCPPPRAGDAVEPFEKPWHFRFGDAGSRIAHRQFDLIAHGTKANDDLSGHREFECVRHQVENNFLPHVAVDKNRLAERRAIDDQT